MLLLVLLVAAAVGGIDANAIILVSVTGVLGYLGHRVAARGQQRTTEATHKAAQFGAFVEGYDELARHQAERITELETALRSTERDRDERVALALAEWQTCEYQRLTQQAALLSITADRDRLKRLVEELRGPT